MSVVMLELGLYQEVYNKVCKCKNSRTSEVGTISGLNFLTESSIRHWIAKLYEMNDKSYCARYKEEFHPCLLGNEAISKWRYDDIQKKPCNIYQLLKYLHCIDYQIEEDAMRDADLWDVSFDAPMRILRDMIGNIEQAIINNIPEYKEAKWWDV